MHRVHGRDTFRRLAGSTQRSAAGVVRVARLDAPDDDPGTVAVAFAVSRRHGSAVHRNRLRRRLRAAARELVAAGVVPPGTYLLSPTARATEPPRSFDLLRRDLAVALDSIDPRGRSDG